MERIPYDEFGLFDENAAEVGLVLEAPPVVRRERVDLGDGRQLSALIWGDRPPELVLLHGGAQNAHTWDTVALLLGRPLVAIDLPGHGHSDGARASGSLTSIQDLAADVAVAVRALAPDARAVVGMSLGGMTTLGLYDHAPELVRRIVLVDVLPSANPEKAKLITNFVNGPPSFANFEDLLARTIEHNPTRMESSLRRGILHNAVQQEDGSWVWRHARHRAAAPTDTKAAAPAEASPSERAQALEATAAAAAPTAVERTERFSWLWDVVSGVQVPLLLVRGMAASSVVDDEHEAELGRRLPAAKVERVEGAGHSVQGDKPVVLAGLIADFIA